MRKLNIQLPRLVKRLHQIELTNHCNLRCVYCPNKDMARPKSYMSLAIYQRSLEWVSFFVRGKTQKGVNLAGIGESTMHPEFVEYVRLAREAVGPSGQIIFATNGVKCDENQVKAIAPYSPEVWVSLHRPSEAGKAIAIYRKYGLLAGTSSDPSVNANDWAGQVEWHNSTCHEMPCQWIRYGFAMALPGGEITTCCYDTDYSGVIGHVNDRIGSLKTKPYDLCRGCHQIIGVEGFNQHE